MNISVTNYRKWLVAGAVAFLAIVAFGSTRNTSAQSERRMICT